MDSHNGVIVDSFVKRLKSAENESIYNFRVESSIAESCGNFGWAACRACFAGTRSVKECLAVLFCPRPEVKLNVGYYQILTTTSSELVTPLLSWNSQDNQEQHADTELCDPVIDDDLLPSLEPLGSVTYKSLSDEDLSQFLRCDGGSTDTSLMHSSSVHTEIPQRH